MKHLLYHHHFEKMIKTLRNGLNWLFLSKVNLVNDPPPLQSSKQTIKMFLVLTTTCETVCNEHCSL